MKELRDILARLRGMAERREPAWLATVVRVQGSAYRQPGARLLLGPEGPSQGSVSGGCLEGDLWARVQREPEAGPRLVRYDLRSEQDLLWGSGMGCSGEIEVLVERLALEPWPEWAGFVESCFASRRKGLLVTVLAAQGPTALVPGTRVCLDRAARAGAGLASALQDVEAAQRVGLPFERRVTLDGATLDLLVEPILPAPALWIFGASDDARPLVALARALGWRVGLVDHRPAFARRERFPDADDVQAGPPAEIVPGLRLDDRSAALLMTHDYARDGQALRALWPTAAFYVGLMGARQRGAQLLAECGHSPEAARARGVFAPVGLDVGGESPESVALAVLAEIQAALVGRDGGHLRDKPGPIHRLPAAEVPRACCVSSPAPGCVVLAAGRSSRLGQPKQLVRIDGQSLVRRTAGLALVAGFAPVVVVCGSSGERVRAELAGLDVVIVDNPGWAEGVASSIRAGIGALPAACPAVLLSACDQPALGLELLRGLRAAHAANPRVPVACEYQGTRGIPALLPRALFSELLALEGDRGARAVLGKHAATVVTVSFPGGELDLDTPAELERWRQ